MSCPDENVLLAFVDGGLGAAAVSAVESHIAGCQACADLVAGAAASGAQAVAAASEAFAAHPGDAAEGMTLARGQAIGRFVVLHAIGRGGMGEVYAAYDPELDRKVAIKLLRSRRSGSPEGRARLLREAQAIARLSHPNVIVVYEVGTFGDRVFIVMEFVRGDTVEAWLARGPRTWRDTLRVFRAAGRGLAAAHAAGIIHRDFKPENVMVTRDERVRVMDFGLARQVPGEGEAALTQSSVDAERDGVEGPGGYLQAKITQTGMQVGTPAYMAPEQFVRGGVIGPHTDQFAFCVALYQALYGERPFEGNSIGAISANVVQGRVRPAPEKSQVPTWLRRILLKGLAVDPGQRFPSMVALLDALEKDPTVQRRTRLMVAGGAALVLGVAIGANRIGTDPRTLCAGGAARLAGIWEPGGASSTRKAAIRRAFEKTTKPYAGQAFDAAAKLLDDYVGRWVSTYEAACQATHVRGEQSAEVLDLRMACLDERLGNARALTDVLLNADDGIVRNAASAAGSLPELDRCSDVALLRAVVRPPEHKVARKRVDELKEQLARLIALLKSGQCARAEATAKDLIPAARETGYQPLLADVLNAAAFLGEDCGDPVAAVARAREAYVAANIGHHDQAAAEVAILLPVMLGERLGQVAVAREWLLVARGALQRLGENKRLETLLLNSEGLVYSYEHDYDRSLEIFRHVLAIAEKTLGPEHPNALTYGQNLGNTLASAGRFQEALEVDRSVGARVAKALGSHHASVGVLAGNEGEALNHLGRHAEARVAFQRALAILREVGADGSMAAYSLTGLGVALLGERRPADAIAPLERASAIRVEKKLAPPLIAETHFALARALFSRPAARTRAIGLATQARADYGRDADPKMVAEVDAWLAQAKGAE